MSKAVLDSSYVTPRMALGPTRVSPNGPGPPSGPDFLSLLMLVSRSDGVYDSLHQCNITCQYS